jgi:hypothetical protein
VTRKERAAELRTILAEYRGCRFHVGGSGGAQGMVFLQRRDGKRYFIGGFTGGSSEVIVRALNLVLELIYGE